MRQRAATLIQAGWRGRIGRINGRAHSKVSGTGEYHSGETRRGSQRWLKSGNSTRSYLDSRTTCVTPESSARAHQAERVAQRKAWRQRKRDNAMRKTLWYAALDLGVRRRNIRSTIQIILPVFLTTWYSIPGTSFAHFSDVRIRRHCCSALFYEPTVTFLGDTDVSISPECPGQQMFSYCDKGFCPGTGAGTESARH